MDSIEEAPTSRLAALRRPVALALSGGGARGAAQAGVAVELIAAGLRPDMIIGTSIGAWNGAWLAAHPDDAESLATWWLDAEVRRIFRGMWLGYAGALAWRRSAALSAGRVDHLLHRGLGELTFEELPVPLVIGAADLLTADLVYFDRGPVAPAVRASSAIPTVLPPVALGDRLLVDGGILDNFGVHEAVRRGARSIILVDVSTYDLVQPPVGLGEIFDRSTVIAQVHQRRRSAAAAAGAGVPLHLIEASNGESPLDFQHAEAALEHGRVVARAWLAGETLPLLRPSPPAEERRRLLQRWRVLEEQLVTRMSAMPLWRRVAQYGNGSGPAITAADLEPVDPVGDAAG
jgi:NTE family protein